MKAYDRLIQDVITGFRKYKGRAGLYIPKPVSPFNIIQSVINLFLLAHKDSKVLIVCKTKYDANKLLEKSVNEDGDKLFDVLTEINFKNSINYNYDLIITYNVYSNTKLNRIRDFNTTRFYLFIFDTRIISSKYINNREGEINFIYTNVTSNQILQDYVNSPVKETLIKCSLSDKEEIKYKEYNDFIAQTMKIFGCFETLDRCRVGDKVMNYSAITVCNIVAENNGWNDELDTTTHFGAEIDNIYNPNALHERAVTAYNIMRERRNIVTDSENKFNKILDICNNNKDKKIIIVCCRSEYANKLSEYLNSNNCQNVGYHDGLENTYEYDDNGFLIYYKTGEHKGEPKIIGAVKQSTNNEKKYNNDLVNVLIIKASSNQKLNVDCDILIFTSPYVGKITDIRYRFINICFNSNPLELYTIYLNNTIENNIVDKYENTPIHEIIRDDETFFISE